VHNFRSSTHRQKCTHEYTHCQEKKEREEARLHPPSTLRLLAPAKNLTPRTIFSNEFSFVGLEVGIWIGLHICANLLT